MVFTKCKPFHLDIPGRMFIFGKIFPHPNHVITIIIICVTAGDLLRIEKEKEFPSYLLLFNDILIFSTMNRDRVLFIMEEPINLKSITESFFNIRKKGNLNLKI